MNNKKTIRTSFAVGAILAAVMHPGPASASGNYVHLINDTLPKKNLSAKKVKSHTYNKQTKKITIVFTDGTREVMSQQTAVNRGYLQPPKVVMTRFRPPVIIKDSIAGDEQQNPVFQKIEIEPAVDPRAWNAHLDKNRDQYIKKASEQKTPPGTYTVIVHFVVEKDGSVTGATALNDPGYGLGRAASELVQTGPKWKPGQQNGRLVRAYKKHPVTFVIEK